MEADKSNTLPGTSDEGRRYAGLGLDHEASGSEYPACETELAGHVGALRASLSRYTADPNRLDDFVQQSMLEALRSVRARGPPHKPLPWLLQVGHRTALRVINKDRRYRYTELSDSALSCDDEGPYCSAEDSELADQLRDAMGSVSKQERDFLRGLYFEGRSCRELAAEAGMTRENVRSRLYRARQRLRKHLG